MIKTLLVDDHCIIRSCIKQILQDIPGISIVGEAENGKKAIKLAPILAPNVVLMDLSMPEMGGLEATKHLLNIDPDIKVLILTSNNDNSLPLILLEAGASGYLTKNTRLNELVHAIRAVHMGQRYIAPDIAYTLVIKQLKGISTSPFASLSERERQIAAMVGQGIFVKEISKQLAISPKTVNSYRYRVFGKLGIENDVQLARLANQHKLALDSAALTI